jgi:hypothetical protein
MPETEGMLDVSGVLLPLPDFIQLARVFGIAPQRMGVKAVTRCVWGLGFRPLSEWAKRPSQGVFGVSGLGCKVAARECGAVRCGAVHVNNTTLEASGPAGALPHHIYYTTHNLSTSQVLCLIATRYAWG